MCQPYIESATALSHMYMFVDQNYFCNHIIAIDSLFQTFVVGLLVKIIG